MKQHFTIIAIFATGLLNSCGGGSFTAKSPDAAGSPQANLSAASLTFGSEIVGTASPAQSIILRNDGTAKLSIKSIAASTNFAAATNCGPALASGTKCVISVT